MKLIERIIDRNIKKLSVIGLAKNTGKTVTFNTLITECLSSGLRPGLVSFGRDGESIDAITLLEKPRIHVPPDTLFVTAERFINPYVIDIKSEVSTGIFTVFGETKVYTSGSGGGMAELIGINTVSGLSRILPLLEEHSDLVLIDGALDRRSSAVPLLSEACVLATGAVLGMSEDDVVRHTKEEVSRLRISEIDNPALEKATRNMFAAKSNGFITAEGAVVKIADAEEAITKAMKDDSLSAVIINGALTDRRAEMLLSNPLRKNFYVIIKDSTRMFLSSKNMTLMEKRGMKLRVADSVNLLAITVNPTRPFFPEMDSEFLVSAFRKLYPEYLCYNIINEEYRGSNDLKNSVL